MSTVSPDDAERAGQEALAIAESLCRLLDDVRAPASEARRWLPEALSFLQARENFRCCLRLLRADDDVPAGALARSLFEEAIRWSWVDEAYEDRRMAFLGAAAHRHRQVAEAAEDQEADATAFYGSLVESTLLPAAEGAPRFPRRLEDQLDWGLGGLSDMLYLQYRLMSQYTHSSLLAAASTVEVDDGQLVNRRRLPIAARLTVLRNAVANMHVIVTGCETALVLAGPVPLNVAVLSAAVEVAELVAPHTNVD